MQGNSGNCLVGIFSIPGCKSCRKLVSKLKQFPSVILKFCVPDFYGNASLFPITEILTRHLFFLRICILHADVHKRVFMTYVRMSTNKESKARVLHANLEIA